VHQVLQAIERSAADLGIYDLQLVNYFPSLSEYTTLLEAQGFRVTYAEHFDRPTQLDGLDGLRNWVRMFRASVIDLVPSNKQNMFFQKIEELARPALYYDDSWWADYVRLRAVAIKS
jgi:hypothetical protein